MHLLYITEAQLEFERYGHLKTPLEDLTVERSKSAIDPINIQDNLHKAIEKLKNFLAEEKMYTYIEGTGDEKSLTVALVNIYVYEYYYIAMRHCIIAIVYADLYIQFI